MGLAANAGEFFIRLAVLFVAFLPPLLGQFAAALGLLGMPSQQNDGVASYPTPIDAPLLKSLCF
jgi:hypothetical protein